MLTVASCCWGYACFDSDSAARWRKQPKDGSPKNYVTRRAMRDAAIAKAQKEADDLMAGAQAHADKVIEEAESK